MLVMTSKSENKNNARSFLVPWFDAMVTRSWRMNALRHRTDSCHFQMNIFLFSQQFPSRDTHRYWESIRRARLEVEHLTKSRVQRFTRSYSIEGSYCAVNVILISFPFIPPVNRAKKKKKKTNSYTISMNFKNIF